MRRTDVSTHVEGRLCIRHSWWNRDDNHRRFGIVELTEILALRETRFMGEHSDKSHQFRESRSSKRRDAKEVSSQRQKWLEVVKLPLEILPEWQSIRV